MIFNLCRVGPVFVGRLQSIPRHLGFCARRLCACNNQLTVAWSVIIKQEYCITRSPAYIKILSVESEPDILGDEFVDNTWNPLISTFSDSCVAYNWVYFLFNFVFTVILKCDVNRVIDKFYKQFSTHHRMPDKFGRMIWWYCLQPHVYFLNLKKNNCAFKVTVLWYLKFPLLKSAKLFTSICSLP